MGGTNQNDKKPPLFTLEQVSNALDNAMNSTLNQLTANHHKDDNPVPVPMENSKIIDLTGSSPKPARKRSAVPVQTTGVKKITLQRNHEEQPLQLRLQAQNQRQPQPPRVVTVQTPAQGVIRQQRNQENQPQNTMLATNQYRQPPRVVAIQPPVPNNTLPPRIQSNVVLQGRMLTPNQLSLPQTTISGQNPNSQSSRIVTPINMPAPRIQSNVMVQGMMLPRNQPGQSQNTMTTRDLYNPPPIVAPAQNRLVQNVMSTQNPVVWGTISAQNRYNLPRKMSGKKRSAVLKKKTPVKNQRGVPKKKMSVRNQFNQPPAMPPVQSQCSNSSNIPATQLGSQLIKMNHPNDELNEMGLPIPSTSTGFIQIFNSDSEDEMIVLNKTDGSIDSDDSDNDSIEGTDEDMDAYLENLLKDPEPLNPMDAKSVSLRAKIDNVRKSIASVQALLRDGDTSVLRDGGARLRANMEAEQGQLVELEEEYYNHISLMPGADNFGGLSISVANVEALHHTLKSRPKEDDCAQNPRGLLIPLMRHQQHALLFMDWREQQNPAGGILADDMGLGKTLTLIALILRTSEHIINTPEDTAIDSELYYNDDDDRPKTLVVCPASLLTQWQSEIRKHTAKGCLRTKIFHGPNRPRTVNELKSYDVIITTYHLIAQRDKNDAMDPRYARDKRPCPLKEIHWRRIILDEAHIIRNHQTAFFKKIKELDADKRWALTGTPIQNKAEDMFSILSFLKCRPFDRIKVWRKLVRTNPENAHQRIATLINTIMLRRTKKELMEKGQIMPLPEKIIEVVPIKLNEEERNIYEEFLVWSQTMLQEYLRTRAEKTGQLDTFLQNGGFNHSGRRLEINRAVLEDLTRNKELLKKQGMMYILVLILRLRQACCHPALIHGSVDSSAVEQVGADNDIDRKDVKKVIEDLSYAKYSKLTSLSAFEPLKPSTKLEAILAKVRQILDTGEKMIIVSQWTKYLDIIEKHLKNVDNASWGRFTGAENIEKRQGVVEDFNNPQTEPMILLLSLTAGGVGLNLVGANHMLFVDVHWNPQLESQCSDRIYRFGQRKNCFIYKFLCSDSMEEKVKDLQEHKLKIANDILTPGADRTIGSRLSLGDIKNLFGIA